MRKNILIIGIVIIMAVMLVVLTGCGNKEEEKSANVSETGNLSLQLQRINSFSEDLAAAKKDGKWGYIDKKGNVVIDFIYENASDFSEGLAAVDKDGKSGYINTKGEVVVDFVYRSTYSFSNGYGVIREGSYYGVIDKAGNVIIEPNKYMANIASISYDLFLVDGAYTGDTKLGYDIINKNGEVIVDGIAATGTYSDELILVKQLYVNGTADMQKGKYGFLDKNGNVVIDYQFDYAGPFKDGVAGVVKDGKIGYINKKGEYVINAEYPYENNTILRDYACGIVRVYDGEKSIYFDEKGKKVFELNSKSAGDFSENMAVVKENDKSGYMNTNGKVVIDYKYTKASEFSSGLALVYTDDENFEFINSDGKTILAGKIVK